MSCFTEIKNALEKQSGVKVVKDKENNLIIRKNRKVLTTYNLRFVEYSRQNTDSFIDYWEHRLKRKTKKKKGDEVK